MTHRRLKSFATSLLIVTFNAASIFALPVTTLQDAYFAKPLKKCWERVKAETILGTVASDNELNLILHSDDQSLSLISATVAVAAWPAQVASEIVGAFGLRDGNIALISNFGDGGAIVRVLSGATGISKWQRELPARVRPDRIFVVGRGAGTNEGTGALEEEMLVLGEDGIVRLFGLGTGVLTEIGPVSVHENDLIVASSGGILFPAAGRWVNHSFSSESPEVFGTVPAPITALVGLDGNTFAFGDASGRVGVHKVGGKTSAWQLPTGGAVTEVHGLLNLIVAASRDNFLYALDKSFGTLKWKVRFPGRLRPLSVTGRYAAVSVVDADRIEILDLKSGKRINSLVIEKEEGDVSGFNLIESQLIVRVGTALRAYAPNCQPK